MLKTFATFLFPIFLSLLLLLLASNLFNEKSSLHRRQLLQQQQQHSHQYSRVNWIEKTADCLSPVFASVK